MKAGDVKVGDRFGRLLVTEVGLRRRPSHSQLLVNSPGTFVIRVLCDCGVEKITGIYPVLAGTVKSCGCFNAEKSTKHGHCINEERSKLYSTWVSMKQRCFNFNDKGFHNYGGRGITVFNEWATSDGFIAFADYVEVNLGPRPSRYQLDRINNDGNYEPGNLRWASFSEQRYNSRQNFGRNIYMVNDDVFELIS